MKKRTWLVARIIVVLLAAVPTTRADRPNVLLKPEGKPDAGGQLQRNRDQKIEIICQTLKDMGRADVAGDLERDYASGVVRLDTFSDRGTTAYTQKNGITLNDGALGVEIMQSPRDNRTMAFGCGVSGALTVLHEYIHLRQSQERAKTILNPFDSSATPDQIPEWENKAWTGTIMEASQWVARVTREVEQIGPGATFEARADKLALALKYLKELNTSCGSLANGLTGAEGEIAAGHVTAASAFGGRTQDDLMATLDAMQQRVNGGLARVRIDLPEQARHAARQGRRPRPEKHRRPRPPLRPDAPWDSQSSIAALTPTMKTTLAFVLVSLLAATAAEPKKEKPFTPGGIYRQGDLERPRPTVIVPPSAPGQPPSDARVLFDGKDLSQFKRQPKKGDPDTSEAPKWKIEHGYAEIAPKSGSIETRAKFGSSQIHIEWATPAEVKGSSQGRGNSGVLLSGWGEVQVLDSFENDTYPDGQAAAIYSNYPPLVNASRRPGEWQSFDLICECAKIDATGKVLQPARLTVIHNGVVVHHAVERPFTGQEFGFALQDHNNPTRYRNIWVRPLHRYDENAKK